MSSVFTPSPVLPAPLSFLVNFPSIPCNPSSSSQTSHNPLLSQSSAPLPPSLPLPLSLAPSLLLPFISPPASRRTLILLRVARTASLLSSTLSFSLPFLPPRLSGLSSLSLLLLGCQKRRSSFSHSITEDPDALGTRTLEVSVCTRVSERVFMVICFICISRCFRGRWDGTAEKKRREGETMKWESRRSAVYPKVTRRDNEKEKPYVMV